MSPRSAPSVASRRLLRVLPLALALLLPAGVEAQPFGSWNIYSRSNSGAYIQIPDAGALNPVGAITIEGWVGVADPSGCSSIVGKGYASGWWVGLCGTTLRSYLRGVGSNRDGGTLPSGWNHFAVTWNGSTRRHYINGEQVGEWAETGNLPANDAPVRIGSDANWGFAPNGAINEIRLWNVARSVSQIREAINEPITSAQPGLVAVWRNGGPVDVVGPHDGVVVGGLSALTFPVAPSCGAGTATSLCLNGRHGVSVRWRTDPPGGALGQGQVAPLSTAESGLFWFFGPNNWEVMVKVLNGCGLNNRWWVFSAATTNVYYRLEVFDIQAGVNKVYFNYPGPPAPAVTDTSALATCP